MIVDKGKRMKQAVTTFVVVVVGLFTVNYWLTAKLEMREPLVGCWPIVDPFIGFCF